MSPRTLRVALLIAVLATTVALAGCVADDTEGTPAPEATGAPDTNTTEEPPDDIAAAFEQRMAELDSFTATQTITTTFEDNETTITRRIWARPATGEYRFEVVSADGAPETVTVINESETVTYDPDANEVTRIDRSGVDQGAFDAPTTVEALAAADSIESEGTEEVDGRETDRVSADLPGDNTEGELIAWLDPGTYFPVRVETVLGSGDERAFSSVVEYENVALNPDISDAQFTLDPPEDAEESEIEPPETTTFDSVEELAAESPISVPEPTLPAEFELDDARLIDGNVTAVNLRYTNGSGSVSVNKRSEQREFETDDGETVTVGDREGTYQEVVQSGLVSWTCDGSRYTVTGQLSREALLEIAASVECA